MKPIKSIFFTAAFVLLSACNIYQPYRRPEINTDGLYRDIYTNDGNDSLSLGSYGWREVFTDTCLQTLISEGLENNFDLRAAILTIRQSQAKVDQSKAAYAPSLGLGVNGNLIGGNGREQDTWNATLTASWQIDLFGQLLNAKRGAQAALLQNEAYRCAVQSQLIGNIASIYFTLLALDEQLRISEETLENWIKNVETMELLMKSGVVNNAAVVQTRANRYNVETTIPDLKRQIRENENALSLLLGRHAGRINRGKLLRQQMGRNMISTGVPTLLLSRRPDVRRAEAALMVAYANTGVARSQFWPSINVGATGGYNNSVLGAIINPPVLLGSLAGGLTQPLFNRLALVSNLKVMKAEQEKALLAFEKSLINAGNEVSNALYLYETARAKGDARREQLKALQQSVEYTEALLMSGSSTYLEVLTARQALLNAQLNGVADYYQRCQGIINLYTALGGGSN